MDTFKYDDYRTCLSHSLRLRKLTDPRCNFAAIAAATRIPKSTISKVFTNKSDFTEDQLYLVASFLEISDSEQEYLSLLLAAERTAVTQRKKKILEKVRSIREQNTETKDYLKVAKKQDKTSTFRSIDESDFTFFADARLSLIHVCLSIKEYARNPHLLCAFLPISNEHLRTALNKLEELNLITKNPSSGYTPTNYSAHISKDSFLYQPWLRQMRSLSETRIIDGASKTSPFSFTVAFSADEDTRLLIKTKFLEFIKDVEETAKSAPKERAYQLNFDLHAWD